MLLNGICYSKEMQEQAAPARFKGNYPIPLSIAKNHLPRDKFFWSRMLDQKKLGLIQYDSRSLTYTGSFPKLILKINDPELITLSGENYDQFDNIDCKDVHCTCVDKPRYEQILPGYNSQPDSILYNACKRTIFAAAKRQMKSAPVPDAAVALHFVQWAKQKVDELIGDKLNNFGYSFNQWYNHLTLSKQKDMDEIHNYLFGKEDGKPHYTGTIDPCMFHYEGICKVEIQALDGKPRMVCSIPPLMKYVMGPICWKLEEIFQDNIPSYCGGMNLNELETKINHYIDLGFTTVAEGDGSAFDNTQDVFLKELDRYVYRRILPQVHHVPQELFDYCANQYYKVMDIMIVHNKQKKCLMRYAILGTVFSGDCDTTCMNTLRMGFYNWYVNEMNGFRFAQQFICFAKGDDFTIMYHYTVDRKQAEAGYWKYFLAKFKPPNPNDPDERQFGLGQILKFIEFGGPEIIKFCSLRAYIVDEVTQHIYLLRDPKKFLHLSKYSRKTLHYTESLRICYLLQQAEALRTMYPGIEYMEAMSHLYEATARLICTHNNSWSSAISKLKQVRDHRKTILLEPQLSYDGYNYEPRHDYITLVAGLTWWESMQTWYHTKTTQLTPQQLHYVNSQIYQEFQYQEIQSLVGFVAA